MFGPFFAPHSPTDFAGPPSPLPTRLPTFGTDHLGQDVLSRFLWGGREILVMAALATALGLVLGTLVGLLAAYSRNWLDDVLMRAMDVILAFPQIMLALVAIATVGPKAWLIVLAVGLTTMPARRARHPRRRPADRRARLRRRGRGARRAPLAHPGREVLPNILSPLMVEASLRLTYSIGLIAALAFLGFATSTNGANWGTDDPGEPDRRLGPALGSGAAGARDRAAHDRHGPRRRRHLARRRRHRPRTVDRMTDDRTAPDVPSIVVDGLRIVLRGTGIDIVDDVSFTIAPGEVLGLVGESGSGKTTVGLALLGHARRGAEIAAGSVRIGDVDVLALSEEQRRPLRGRVVSYVPQDPAAALNPALRIGTQLREALEVHDFGGNDGDRRERVAEMMREVALPDDPGYLRRYPHELSGGQQQRVGLAMAFACRPRLIVLDEPTTGLDVTTQAHVLDTVRELAAAHKVAALYVSHDLAVVSTLADRVAVMYAGRIVELGESSELFANAAHPYTRRLVAAMPHLAGSRELIGIPGRAPSPGSRPRGCAFAPRCASSRTRARLELPPLRPLDEGHRCAACAPRRCGPIRCRSRGEAMAVASRTAKACSRRSSVGRLPRRHRRARHQPRARAQRVPRAGRRVGLGQDHAGALDRGPAPRAVGPHPAGRGAAGGARPRTGRGSRAGDSSTSSRTRTGRSTRAARSARSCASRWSCSGSAAARPTHGSPRCSSGCR